MAQQIAAVQAPVRREMKQFKWTTRGYRTNGNVVIPGPFETFNTKKEAVDNMMRNREPKTLIMKHGRHYEYVLPK